MISNTVKYAPKFGTCVMFVSLLVSGCAHQTGVQAMRAADLEYFQINCSLKEQQIRFLQSQRVSRDDRMYASLYNIARPWTLITDPDGRAQRSRVQQGYTNWLIDQHLMSLATQCP